MNTITQLKTNLHRQLIEEADRLGRESGFIQRRRKIDAATFVQGLVWGFCANPASTYCELSQGFGLQGKPISAQGLEQRFGEASARLMQQLLGGLVQVVLHGPAASPPVLERFQGVYIRDSSLIGLPDSLQPLWRGSGNSRGETAALKLQVCLNYTTGQVEGPLLQSGRAHDRTSPFQDEPLPAGALRLADLGYFELDRFDKANREGVYWISRLKQGTVVYDERGQRLDLSAWLRADDSIQRDVTIQLGKTHRLACRVIVERVPPAVAQQRRRKLREIARKKQVPLRAETLALADWTLLVTNIPPEMAAVPEILLLGHVRWQVELLFRLWKDRLRIDEWRSRNPWRILTEIYAKLIGLVICQWIFQTMLWTFPNRSLYRAIRVIQQLAPLLLIAFTHPGKLTPVLRCLQFVLPTVCRVDRRRSKPAAWQQFLRFAPLQPLS